MFPAVTSAWNIVHRGILTLFQFFVGLATFSNGLTVSHRRVHPVLLRPASFLIRTVNAVAIFLTVLKSSTNHGLPSLSIRRPVLRHVHPAFSTVAWNVAAVAAGNLL